MSLFTLKVWTWLGHSWESPSAKCQVFSSLQRCVRQTSSSCGRRCQACRAARRPWNRPRAWTWAPTAPTLPQPSPKLPALTSHCTACKTDRATPQRETGTDTFHTVMVCLCVSSVWPPVFLIHTLPLCRFRPGTLLAVLLSYPHS